MVKAKTTLWSNISETVNSLIQYISENRDLILKFALVIPLVLVWDAFYWLLSKLYNFCTYIDDVGGEKVRQFIHGE